MGTAIFNQVTTPRNILRERDLTEVLDYSDLHLKDYVLYRLKVPQNTFISTNPRISQPNIKWIFQVLCCEFV